jgi:NADPH:quinone reductase-like Zn-dependent oxidoreductase
MRAAVIDHDGGDLVVRDVADPRGNDVVRVVAAPLNPVDRAIAAGMLRFRKPGPGDVLGLEGVAERTDGTLVYFFAPPFPGGSFAELVPLAGAETVDVPSGVDAVTAAAIGVPGIAAALSLRAAELRPDDTVLVLGATGAVGTLAVQIAVARGAAKVIGTARDARSSATLESFGSRAAVATDSGELDAALSALAPDGVDVVIDLLWGDFFTTTVRHLATGGRVVQVGNASGATAEVAAPEFRNRGARLIGHSNFLVTPAERAQAYAEVAGLAAGGSLAVRADAVGFSEFEAIWRTAPSGKHVFTF